MTEKNGDKNNWRSTKNFIKEILSKSGTELMEIATTSNKAKNGAAKKTTKNNDSQIKMVYYQSTSLIPKSENPSQAQLLCAPLQLPTASPIVGSTNIPTLEQEQPNVQGHYYFNKNITVMQKAPQNTSIGQIQSLNNLPNPNFHTNIKTEISTVNIITGSPPSLATIAVPNITTFNNNAVESSGTNVLASTAVRRRAPTAKKAQFKCEQCGMMFGSKSAHTSHTKSHGKSVGETASNASAVIDVDAAGPLGIPKMPQIKINNNGGNGGDPYQCNVCQKTFAVPARLIRHYRTHTGERPFECEFCHKLFSVKENLQVHRRIHTKERPYKCEVCGRAFEHSGKLHRHMRIHTGERPHKCSVCEKTFIQSGQLVIHMRTHTGEKPYKCPVVGCGKGFTCSKQLKVHSRTHTGEKPYHCDICFRDFGYNHVLKLHRVQHYGSKCYKCTICDETFKSKKEMEAHIKGHANDDDEEDEAIARETPTTSNGSSASVQDSPATTSFEVIKTKRRKVERKNSTITNAALPLVATNSPMPSISPSSTTSISNSMTSRITPAVSLAESHIDSPAAAILETQETDYRNHHSNEDELVTRSSHYEKSSTPTPTLYSSIEEMPTDLSIQQEPPPKHYLQPEQEHTNTVYIQQHYEELHQPQSSYYENNRSYHQSLNTNEQLTINPALLEAASIASRCVITEPRESEITEAALQIMQLNRSQQHQYQQPQINQSIAQSSPSPPQPVAAPQHRALISDVANYDDTKEANDLIRHYKRGELAQHGIHKGYAPVPKFESSLLNNEIIVRQVEAAIAPLRSSTESPERSSSPESESSMMMADRDIMTLPLRKRKLYMSDSPKSIVTKEKSSNNGSNANSGSAGVGNNSSSNEIGTRVMRMSSVIQFAKAS